MASQVENKMPVAIFVAFRLKLKSHVLTTTSTTHYKDDFTLVIYYAVGMSVHFREKLSLPVVDVIKLFWRKSRNGTVSNGQSLMYYRFEEFIEFALGGMLLIRLLENVQII